jgi:CHASE3 domain sensor protein
MIKKFKENFISISLSVLITLLLLNTVLIFYNRAVMVRNNVLQKQTEEVKKAWTEIFESNLRRMDLGLRGYALTRKTQLLDPYETGKRDMDRTLFRIDSLLTVQNLDSLKGQFDIFQPKVKDYIQYSEEMKNYARQDNVEAFVKLLNEDRGYDLWQAFAPMYNYINSYQDRLMDSARSRYQQAMDRNVIFQVVLVLLTIPTLIAVMYRIRRDARNRKKLLADFDQNNRRFLFDSGQALSADDPQVIIQSSIKNLKKASSFIKDIAGGNYGVAWDGLTSENEALNQQNLAGDLIKMRDQMKKVKELDEGWLNSPMSQGIIKTISRSCRTK